MNDKKPSDSRKIDGKVFDLLIGFIGNSSTKAELRDAAKKSTHRTSRYVSNALRKLKDSYEDANEQKVATFKLIDNILLHCDDDAQEYILLQEQLRIAKDLNAYDSAIDILGLLVIIASKLGKQSNARQFRRERERMKAIHQSKSPYNPRSHPRRGMCAYYRKSDELCNKVAYALVCPYNARVTECPIGSSKRRKRKKLIDSLGGLGKEAARGYIVDAIKIAIGIVVLVLLEFLFGLLSLMLHFILNLLGQF